jgi:hypothetical protein
MATNIQINDQVFVPRKLLGLDPNDVSPFWRTTVREKKENARSVRVDLPNGARSEWVATSKISRQLGILILRIGDYEEWKLIDPLFKSVLHFCNILLTGDYVRPFEVRTIRELIRFWRDHHAGYDQVVFVGHGSESSVMFGDRDLSARRLVQILAGANPQPKEFISLCCQTGQQPFAKPFSQSDICTAFLGPFHSVHGCIASQFCQNYLTNRLLDNQSIGVAFNNARRNLLGTASFRLWQGGILKAGQR